MSHCHSSNLISLQKSVLVCAENDTPELAIASGTQHGLPQYAGNQQRLRVAGIRAVSSDEIHAVSKMVSPTESWTPMRNAPVISRDALEASYFVDDASEASSGSTVHAPLLDGQGSFEGRLQGAIRRRHSTASMRSAFEMQYFGSPLGVVADFVSAPVGIGILHALPKGNGAPPPRNGVRSLFAAIAAELRPPQLRWSFWVFVVVATAPTLCVLGAAAAAAGCQAGATLSCVAIFGACAIACTAGLSAVVHYLENWESRPTAGDFV